MRITDYQGKEIEVGNCLGCARERGEIDSDDRVLRTRYFDAHQDFEIPIPGFIILSSRRHIRSVDEFSGDERADFMNALIRIRRALHETLDIDTVHLVQEENTRHHFHFWIFPRYPWMAERFGDRIPSIRPTMEYAKEQMKTPENLAMVANAISTLRKNLQK